MKAVVAAFNQEKALVGAFSVITNLRMQFGCNFLRHYYQGQLVGSTGQCTWLFSGGFGATIGEASVQRYCGQRLTSCCRVRPQ